MKDPHRVIYGWEDHGLVLEREDRLNAQHDLGRRVAQTRTFRDLQQLVDFDDRFVLFLESIIEDWENQHGKTNQVPDDAPISSDLADWFIQTEIIPLPEVADDPHNDVRSWLPEEAIRLADVGGASPGGNVDWITWQDRRVGEKVLEILRKHGYELVEDLERVRRMWEWPDSFVATSES